MTLARRQTMKSSREHGTIAVQQSPAVRKNVGFGRRVGGIDEHLLVSNPTEYIPLNRNFGDGR